MNAHRFVVSTIVVLLLTVIGAGAAWAEEGTQAAAPAKERTIPTALIALAAALAIGLPALGTAIAQSRIGAAGCGTIAEKPDAAGTVILLIAIPETMVILGFVVAVVLIFAL